MMPYQNNQELKIKICLKDILENIERMSVGTLPEKWDIFCHLATIFKLQAVPACPAMTMKLMKLLVEWLKDQQFPDKEQILMFLLVLVKRQDCWEKIPTKDISDLLAVLSTLELDRQGSVVIKAQKMKTIVHAEKTLRDSAANQSRHVSLEDCVPVMCLPWVTLVQSDALTLHFLEAQWTSARNSEELVELCLILKDLIVKDFPNECFLQRPKLLKDIMHLVDTTVSSEVRAALLELLCLITVNLAARVADFLNPSLANFKFEASRISTSTDLPPGRVFQRYRNTYPDLDLEYGREMWKKLANHVQIAPDQVGTFEFDNSEYQKSLYIPVAQFCLEAMQKGIVYNDLGVADACLRLWHSLHIDYSLWKCSDPRAVYIRVSALRVLKALAISLRDTRNRVMEGSLTGKESIAEAWNEYLFILCFKINLMKTALPMGKELEILPDETKSVLLSILFNYNMMKVFKQTFRVIIDYCRVFGSGSNQFRMYRSVLSVIKGMENSFKLLNADGVEASVSNLKVMKTVLPSLAITHFWEFLRWFVDWCISEHKRLLEDQEVFAMTKDIVVTLFMHNDPEVRHQMFRISYGKFKICLTSDDLSPNFDSACILLDSEVLKAVVNQGFADDKIRNCAINLVKTVIQKWRCSFGSGKTILNQIIPVLTTIEASVNLDPTMANHVLDMLDPLVVTGVRLRPLNVLKGNLRILFSNCSEEVKWTSIERMVYMVRTTLQENSDMEKITSQRLFEAVSSALMADVSNLCYFQPQIDFEAMGNMLEILQMPDQHPVLLESALRHMCVILRDVRLHKGFLERNGLQTLLDIMFKALNVHETGYELKWCIPVIAMLKLIVVFTPMVRLEVASNQLVIEHIVAALAIFMENRSFCQDTVTVLALIAFQDVVKNNTEIAASGDRLILMMPEAILMQLTLPFVCQRQTIESPPSDFPLAETLKANELYMEPLRHCWAINSYGLDVVLEINDFTYEELYDGPEWLKLRSLDIILIQASYRQSYLKGLIYDLQNATNHDSVINTLRRLCRYLALQSLMGEKEEHMVWTSFPWEEKIRRFLYVKPTNSLDMKLLLEILKFLNSGIRKHLSGESLNISLGWIVKMFTTRNSPILDMIRLEDNSDIEVHHEFLLLVKNVSAIHKHESQTQDSSWCYTINVLLEDLACEETPLWTLYGILECLSAITSNKGWSQGYPHVSKITHKFMCLLHMLLNKYIWQTTERGVKASFICSQILKHASICLRNIILELSETWGYQTPLSAVCYALGGKETVSSVNVGSLKDLTVCRDIDVRLAAFESLVALCATAKGRELMATAFGGSLYPLFDLAFRSLKNRNEADIVRCAAVQVILNMIPLSGDSIELPTEEEKVCIAVLQDFCFYGDVNNMTEQLFLGELIFWDTEKCCVNVATTTRLMLAYNLHGILPHMHDCICTSSTLLKRVCKLMRQLLHCNPEANLPIIAKTGVLIMLSRCLQVIPQCLYDCLPSPAYTNAIEMVIEVCSLIKEYLQRNSTYIATITESRQFMESIGFLLEPHLLDTKLEKAVEIRDKVVETLLEIMIILMRDHKGFHDVIGRWLNNLLVCLRMALVGSARLQNIAFDTLEELSSYFVEENSTIIEETAVIRCHRCVSDIPYDSRFPLHVETVQKSAPIFARIMCNYLEIIVQGTVSENRCIIVQKTVLISILTNICYISGSAVQVCVDCGVVECLVAEMATINDVLLRQSSVETSAAKKSLKELQSLVHLFGNILLQTDGKTRAKSCGLPRRILELWPWAHTSWSLLRVILKLLFNFTKDFTTGADMLAQLNSRSRENILQHVLQLFYDEMEEISKGMSEYDTRCAHFTVKVLLNAVHSSRCCTFIHRSTLCSNLDVVLKIATRCRRPGTEILRMWLDLFCSLASHSGKHLGFFAVPELIDLLGILLAIPDTDIRSLTLVFIVHLADVEKLKVAVMMERCLSKLLSILRNGSVEEKYLVTQIACKLVMNSSSRRNTLREYNFPRAFERFALLLGASLDIEGYSEKLELVHMVISSFQ